MKYFNDCENELNNTLVDEILKVGFDKDLTQIEAELKSNESTEEFSTPSKKRVRFMPQIEDIMAAVNVSPSNSLEPTDVSMDCKNELDTCLRRLRTDANAILLMTTGRP